MTYIFFESQVVILVHAENQIPQHLQTAYSKGGLNTSSDIRASVRACFERTMCGAIHHIRHREAGISRPRCSTHHDGQEAVSLERGYDMRLKDSNNACMSTCTMSLSFASECLTFQKWQEESSQPLVGLKLASSFHPLKLKSVWKPMHKLCTERRIGGAECTASEALDEMLHLCLYGLSHFRRPPLLLNTPLSSLRLRRWKLWCRHDKLLAPTGVNTWIHITRLPRGAFSLTLLLWSNSHRCRERAKGRVSFFCNLFVTEKTALKHPWAGSWSQMASG